MHAQGLTYEYAHAFLPWEGVGHPENLTPPLGGGPLALRPDAYIYIHIYIYNILYTYTCIYIYIYTRIH